MKVPLSWIREFVPVRISAQKLAEQLTFAGIEVEEIVDQAKGLERVVVGEVVHVRPHPNAEKLRLAFVVVERGGKPQEIVCGAPNVAVGQKVAVALLGAKLPNGMTIEPRNIRGVDSLGMICAEDELGLGSAHAGTMVLNPDAVIGTPVARVFGLDDVVFDLAIPANRADLLSIRGVAWEISAILGVRFREPKRVVRESGIPSSVRISIAAKKLCPSYVGRVIHGVRVQPSPDWVQRRLNAAGVRPLNAIVDATNYIMLEYGQPLHAFDLAKIHGSAVNVRNAKPGERLTTLDNVQRHLAPSQLVIADADRPIALAGVMGGLETEVSDSTTDVFLESAIFDPVSVRKTSRGLGLTSEASRRFEKGLPHGLQERASAAASRMIVELCAGTVEQPSMVGKKPQTQKPFAFTPALVSDMIGKPVAITTVKSVLTRLGFRLAGSGKTWRVTVPSWRLDVTCAEEIVDEVGRMVGYNDLPDIVPNLAFVPKPLPRLAKLKDDVRDLLVGFGFTETISHAYYGQPVADSVGGGHFEVANPLDRSQQYLRKSIHPQLRDILRSALDAGKDASVFQIGRVFTPIAGKPIEGQQPWKIAIGMAFKPTAGYSVGRKLTGVLDGMFEALGVLAGPTGKAPVHAEPEEKGRIVEWCELDLATMRDNFGPFRYEPLPQYPAVLRDLSLWVPAGMQYVDVDNVIRKYGEPLLESVELFDVYEKDERRSLALHLAFRAADRTLTDREILEKMTVITAKLKEMGAELR